MSRVVLSPEVTQIEEAIDTACLRNPLLKCNRDLALWTYLAFCEDMLFKELHQNPPGPQRSALFADQMVNSMKYPIRWIWKNCKSNGDLPREHDEKRYSAAWDLSKLADQYDPFETVYIFARAGYLQLSANGHQLVHSGWSVNTQFEAYDRLTDNEVPETRVNAQKLFERVAMTVGVKDDRFTYQLTPRLISFACEQISQATSSVILLPKSWRFPEFSLGDFHRVTSWIRAEALIHQMARTVAAHRGCVGLGIRDSVLIEDVEEMKTKICRYTSLNRDTVSNILDILTYDSSGQKSLDPALQPLIPVGGQRLAISPALWINLDVERNFCVLANRIPSARKVYNGLSEDRSRLLERTFRERLNSSSFRFWTGKVPNRDELPDIDLVIIDSVSRTSLALELKSFIQPAEPRELIERSVEIAKGVDQIRKLRDYATSYESEFRELIGIDADYRICFAVASQNSIGMSYVQDLSTPVVRASHLIDYLLLRGMESTCDWLESRAYLPIEGKHFETVPTQNEVAGKFVTWYGIRPLVENLRP